MSRARVLLGVGVGALALSACGAGERSAASIGGHDISHTDVERVLSALADIPSLGIPHDVDAGTFDPQSARQVVGLMIVHEATNAVLADNGESITEQDRAAFLDTAPAEDPLMALPEDVLAFAADTQVAQTALGRIETPADADLARRYRQDPTALGVFCVRHILSETEAAAAEARAQLEDGADFATLAADVSIDPTAADNGGALQGPSGEACMPTAQAGQLLDATFYEAAAGAVPGALVGPVETSFGWHVLEALPYEEAAPSIGALFDQFQGSLLLDGYLRRADVFVDPRYGSWDAAALIVVARS